MKAAQTFSFTDTGFSGDIRHGNGIGKIFMDIGEDFVDAEVVLIGRCLLQIHLWCKRLIQEKTDAGQVLRGDMYFWAKTESLFPLIRAGLKTRE